MYSWTALLVATQGNHVDVVNLLLEHKPNINALDKDGCSALMIACKEGYYEIATALMDSGSYINIQVRIAFIYIYIEFYFMNNSDNFK